MSDIQFSRRNLYPEIGIVEMDSDTGSTPVVVVNTSEPVVQAKEAIRAFRNTRALAIPLLAFAEAARTLWLDLSTAATVIAATAGSLTSPVAVAATSSVDAVVAVVRSRPPLSPVVTPERFIDGL
jgi:hypothetical protein